MAAAFEGFILAMESIQRLYHTTGTALTVMSSLTTGKFMVQAGPYSMVDVARTESESGTPLLNRVFVVFFWSALEVLVEDLVTAWILCHPGSLELEEIKDVKLAVREMLMLDEEDRARYLIQEVSRKVRSPLKSGVDKFESLLNAFGLSRQIDPDLRRTLYELSHLRSVLLHKNAKADRKFVEACPWMGYESGQPIQIPSEHFDRYYHAVIDYSIGLLDRFQVGAKAVAPQC